MLQERAEEDAAAAAAAAADDAAGARVFKKKPGIPFGFMAKHIASMWKVIDEKSLDAYHRQAQQEKSRYSSEMEVYNHKKGKDLELNRMQLEATVDESIKKRYFEPSAMGQAVAVARSTSKQSASKK
jgi:HMG-box domain